MQINKLYRKYGFAKNGWPHLYIRTILAVVLHRKDPKQYLLINMNLHFQKRWSPYFLSDFFFQFKCDVPTDGFENRIPRIASKSILLSLWLTSSLLREDGSHHIFSQYLESFFAWSLTWKIDLINWEYLFFSAQLPLSEKSISWQCKASFALVYNTKI